MNRELFDLYGKTQSAPALQPGDAIILDNLSLQKSPGAAAAMKEVGAWFLCLPPCSPDLNPIKTAFAKFKALIRRAAARTRDAPWQAEGQVCDLFTEEECHTFFKAAGHAADQPQPALKGSRGRAGRRDRRVRSLRCSDAPRPGSRARTDRPCSHRFGPAADVLEGWAAKIWRITTARSTSGSLPYSGIIGPVLFFQGSCRSCSRSGPSVQSRAWPQVQRFALAFSFTGR